MTQKIFVNRERDTKTSITCDGCGESRSVDVSKFMDMQVETTIKINCKCKCGHSFPIILERRKYIRRERQLEGEYISLIKNIKGKMTVVDISRLGLKIQPKREVDLQAGDILNLEFYLDDKENSLIRREVVVKNNSGKFIGVEFLSSEHYDKLGTYLIFN